jgi:hypothetical protein
MRGFSSPADGHRIGTRAGFGVAPMNDGRMAAVTGLFN